MGEAAPLYVVVCSRREEYNAYEATLQLNGAIGLQALTLPQIQDYLAQVNRSELWELLNRDAELLELVQAPLFLSIVLLAYPQDSLEDWRQLGSTQERLQDLWDRYICRMFERELRNNPYRKKEPSQQQSRRWLVWLAQQMQRESQTEFLIEKMQPRWLTGPECWIYQLIFGLIFGLIAGPIFGLIVGPIVGLIVGLIAGPIVGLIVGLIIGLIVGLDDIIPVESIQLLATTEQWQTLPRLRKELIGMLIGVLVFGLFVGLFVGLIGLIGLIRELRADVKVRLQPNQGIRNSARNGVILAGIGPAVIFVLFILALVLNPLFSQQLVPPILLIPAFLLFFLAMTGGGQACIQHLALRFVLFRSGVSPWNYARFLDYASERLLIQRVGGRYRFIHKLLQDHFAEMSLSPPKSPINGGL